MRIGKLFLFAWSIDNLFNTSIVNLCVSYITAMNTLKTQACDILVSRRNSISKNIVGQPSSSYSGNKILFTKQYRNSQKTALQSVIRKLGSENSFGSLFLLLLLSGITERTENYIFFKDFKHYTIVWIIPRNSFFFVVNAIKSELMMTSLCILWNVLLILKYYQYMDNFLQLLFFFY